MWRVTPEREIRAGRHTLRPGAVVLAPGAYDRVVPFPGWDLPGVVTAGGAQAHAKNSGVPVGQRVLVAGTGPFLLAVAATLAGVGADVVAVVEAARLSRWLRHPGAVLRSPGRVLEAGRYLSRRIPLWQGSAVTAVEPYGAALRATVDGHGTVDVDAVCVGHGFTPSVELALAFGCATRTDPRDGSLVVAVDDDQRTTVPGCWPPGRRPGSVAPPSPWPRAPSPGTPRHTTSD
ncbi:FAD-dependent oxidoreductase [Phytohabitans rumicis]|uniref:FAD/NAD(P)-binding domain-containing protein n=1 Tax=Phytohabitans rumicis TaxID=1076125 RepID=A0A6V8L4I2_9ACTN|nr:FAD-dependent oxidoreductase [Phytohabitans rumicis]GFJ92173.1 hypothetical protein Prum_058150 [Phytohabitans rumicis]